MGEICWCHHDRPYRPGMVEYMYVLGKCMKLPVGPYFFKLWYKMHGNIPCQYIHLTCECGHGQMCHAKQSLATDHCSLRGLWFTCMDDAPLYKSATKSTILILQIFSPVLCDNPSSYQVSDSLFVWMQIKFCQCRTSKGSE